MVVVRELSNCLSDRHKGKGKDSQSYSIADSLESEYGAPATQPFVEWVNARMLSTSLSLPFNPYSNSEVRKHLLI